MPDVPTAPPLSDAPGPPVVCITGMHRSGTSLVARALHAAGLWLGREDEWMPAQADNPEGFFEHLALVRTSDALLDAADSAWDAPPPAPLAGGEGPLADRARALLQALASSAPPGVPCGWKDPRASLALPFWHGVQPGLRVLVCLRDPGAVARSLQRRHPGTSLRHGLRLWTAYQRALWPEVCAGRVMVTDHERWCSDPQAELARVLGWIGLDPGPDRLAAAVALVRGGAASAPADAPVDSASAALHEALRAAAAGSPAAAGLPAEPPAALPVDEERAALRNRVGELEAAALRLRHRQRAYRPGTPIDAGLGGNGTLYLEDGWGEPQPAGCWMTAPEAGLTLRPIGTGSSGATTLRLWLRPLLGTGRPAAVVTVACDGQELATWTLDRPRTVELSTRLPEAAEGAERRLQIRTDRTVSPSALGLSADRRALGVLLVRLVLAAA